MMKKNLLVLGAALTLLLTLSACGRQTVIRTTDTLDQAEPEASAAEPLPAEPAAGEKETAWSLDPTAVTDDFAADTLIRLPELALSGLAARADLAAAVSAVSGMVSAGDAGCLLQRSGQQLHIFR